MSENMDKSDIVVVETKKANIDPADLTNKDLKSEFASYFDLQLKVETDAAIP